MTFPRPFDLRCALALLVAIGTLHGATAQLAITEVMSVSRVNTNTGFRGPDYWELTNFSTNDVDLHGYGFRDGVPTRPPVTDSFTNLIIRAGESIIFFRVADSKDVVTNSVGFRAWWGDSKLPPNLQCRIWETPGLSGWDGDAVRLLDPSRNVVDSVEFGQARPGRAFTYEPETGLFGVFSAVGVNGAFAADKADDAGSPGFTTGAVPIRILQQPLGQTVDAGMNATFSASAVSLPRPRYQWFADGVPIANATSATLVLSNVQPAMAGAYHVLISNGLAEATSIVATLTVNIEPAPPTILIPPVDTTVFERQTAVFRVAARGLPAPGYQWQANGTDIPGATSPMLQVPSATQSMSGIRYSVRIWNTLGSTNASVALTVIRRPDLRFTEIMALASDQEGNRHFDWFELTNFDTNEVNLAGWLVSDKPSFVDAFTITNSISLRPGESVVFAERLNEQLFASWWGADQLPPGLKFYTYGGFGLGDHGEQLYLWNAAATDPHDPLATLSWATATLGVSFECDRWCDPEGYGCMDEATRESVLGLNGAFRAAGGADIGSPGYIANPPPRILSVTRPSGGVSVRCRVNVGKSYRLWRAESLAPPAWEPVETRTASGSVLTLSDPLPLNGSTCFYRVEQVP
jgi:hypothetical protein